MKIAITSPAGRVDLDKLKPGLDFISSLGHELVLGKTLVSSEYWTAGSAQLRADEFTEMWLDNSIDVVWAARGGFGCAHLLELIDWYKVVKVKKILCGHSDISVLHLAFLKFGVKRSISSAMPAVELNHKASSLTLESTFSLINDRHSVNLALFKNCQVIKGQKLSGFIVPITLSVLTSLCGTSYMPDLSGAVLVIEDINEAGYRLDGYLNQLRLNGILSKISALVFGDFKNCASSEEMGYLVGKYSNFVHGTVLTGLPFGHCEPRLSLPVGEFIEMNL